MRFCVKRQINYSVDGNHTISKSTSIPTEAVMLLIARSHIPREDYTEGKEEQESEQILRLDASSSSLYRLS